MNTENNIIQFIHPGGYNRGEGKFLRNGKSHKRKFIKTDILFINETGLSENERGYFWGEWEAPSKAKREVFNGIKYYVHKLFIPLTENDRAGITSDNCNFGCNSESDGPLNTDPYVFGKHFYYSNCMQNKYPTLKNLKENDIIIFGSRLNGVFVLDTVFVVDCAVEETEYSDCFESVTLNLLADKSNYRIYKGKMYNEKSNKNEIYSFFPCSNKPFDRPALDLKYITKQKQGIHYIKEKSSKEMWNDIVAAVKGKGLKIGVWAKEPDGKVSLND